MPEGYRTVSLPTELVTEIEELVKDKRLGFTSYTDFIRSASRLSLNTYRIKRTYLNVKEKKKIEGGEGK